MKQANIIEVTTDIALFGAQLSLKYKIPMADSLIYATALLNDAVLWTQDVDFENLPNVRYFKKS